MKILKFGGTSVKSGERIRKMVDILAGLLAEGESFHVVCSAMKGVTDDLITAAKGAEAGDASYAIILEAIWNRQRDAVEELFAPEGLGDHGVESLGIKTLDTLGTMLKELRDICHGIYLVRECSRRSMDLVMSCGERLNNFLVAAYMRSLGLEAQYVDARQVIRTDSSHGRAEVDFETTNELVRQYFSSLPAGTIGIITGFIASTEKGVTTTLGRNGSDYTASIIGAALGASDIEIWTDVDGVLEADPRVVPDAKVIDDLSVDEAMEMSYFGAEVLHPSTIIPAVETGIPIWIKNTMNPQFRGTRISRQPSSGHGASAVTGIATIPRVAMINLVGGGMLGSRGLAGKIFSTLGSSNVNVIMISQASSENSICLVLRHDEAAFAESLLRQELSGELRARRIQRIEVIRDLEVLSVIGASMRGIPGVSGRLFQSLGKAGVNVLAIAQGSSEMNISCVIQAVDHEAAVKAVHLAFFKE